jgi:hypothetical protein
MLEWRLIAARGQPSDEHVLDRIEELAEEHEDLLRDLKGNRRKE